MKVARAGSLGLLAVPVLLAIGAALASDKTGRPTVAEFERLAPDATINLGMRTITKRDFQAQADRVKALAQTSKKISLDALKAERARAAAARVLADNVKVAAMKPQLTTPVTVTCSGPTITGMLAVAPLEPGEEFFLKGYCFGEKQEGIGTAYMSLELNEQSWMIDIVEWKTSYIHGRLRSDMSGVKDQQTKVKIRTAKDKTATYPIEFRAARDYAMLSPQDVTITCGGPNYDKCNLSTGAVTMEALHDYSYFDVGTDRISASVKNGWTFYDAGFNINPPNAPPNLRYVVMSGFTAGTTSTNIELLWTYSVPNAADPGLWYTFSLAAEGVKGTSYK